MGDKFIRITFTEIPSYAKDTLTGILKGLVEIIKGPNDNYDNFTEYKVGLAIGHYILPSLLAARLLFGPTMYPDEMISADETTISNQTISSDFISSSHDSGENITNPLLENIS
ncbi:hypothetical protein P8452_06565 [Trifolium repens]|nr:hypothetical protein P8452_06565 [Trifolium repens]